MQCRGQISMDDRQPSAASQAATYPNALSAAGSRRRQLFRTLATETRNTTNGHTSSRGSVLGSDTIAAQISNGKQADVLQALRDIGCTLPPVWSGPWSCSTASSTDFLVKSPGETKAQKNAMEVLAVIMDRSAAILQSHAEDRESVSEQADKSVAAESWFPRCPTDLDKVVNNILKVEKCSIEHPSFQDQQYQERRRMFAQLAFDYKHDQPIPLVTYTDEENKTWSTVFNRLCDLYDQHACKEFLENFKQLQNIGLYRSDRIPQLRDVSEFVIRRSGFTLRPVAGYLSSRDFLSALALRVFCCTQYIRHWEKPFYTPEPDCCHELLGHVPMLADPAFAHFSQEIGLASLGASDEDVQKLATCYFFTVEFGFCMESDKLKVYGAGLLACVDEFAFAVSDKATIREFDPFVVLQQECKVTAFQDMYFYTASFEEAKEKLRAFARTLRRKRSLVYNPYTQCVENASNAEGSTRVVHDLLARICWDLETALQVVLDLEL